MNVKPQRPFSSANILVICPSYRAANCSEFYEDPRIGFYLLTIINAGILTGYMSSI